MLGNYIAVGLRYLWAHKSYSAINIVGLSCAMACAILSSAYIAEEYRYVNYHENGHRIYRVIREIRRDGDASFSDWVSGGSVVAMRELFPEVEVAARAGATRYTRSWLRAGDVTLSDFFCRADPELLEVFDFGFVRGELRTEPMTAVITESVARKFYGDADPIGETLTLVDAGPMGDYIITGILRDIPKYAYVPIGVLTAAPPTAFVNKEQRIWDGWASDLWGPKGYVRLPEGFQVERVEQALKEVMSRSIPKEMAQKATLHLQPMDEATLYGYGKPGQGSIHTIIFHLMIALIIAAVACANFVNLAVSRTVARAGEIASRKAIGARWSDIVVQFVTEAAVITGVALLLGFVIASFETISGFFGGNLLRPNLLDWRFILGIATAWIGVSLAAGIYPAVLASRVPARDVGRGVRGTAGSGMRVRDVLIVGQLACAVFFIAGTIVVRAQLFRMETADVGFDIDHVLTTRYVFNDSTMRSKREVIKAAFKRTPGVVSATTMWPGPGMESPQRSVFREEDPELEFHMQILGVDPDFLETYGIDLIAGRNVGPDFVRKNSAEFVLNETAVQRLGWGEFGPEGAIGKRLRAGNRRGTVIGVVKDFHYSSFRDAIPPLVMMNWSRIALGIRIRPDRVDETLAAVDQTWREFFSQPLQLKFVDQMWGWNLWRERAQSRAYALLSWTAVLLAGMGVFGMAMYETEQRRREIGVRKVLGATVSGIVAHFWRGHVWLVVVANLVAWPVAYSVLQAWLQEFAYRIPLPATAFLAAGATVGVLFLAVVGTQAARVGLVNPAETLRSE